VSRTLVSLAIVAGLAACPVGVAAARPVPRGFIGVMADGPLTQPGAPLASEARVMGRSGVQSMRTVFVWAQVQPFAHMRDVPAGQRRFYVERHGVPSDFRATDRIVRAVARAGIDVLPVVQVAPDWAARHPGPFTNPMRYGSPPARPGDYARFLRTLVERYAPHGDFWRALPAAQRRPIRRWQVWNEPMLSRYWIDQPYARDYVALLRAAHHAAHAADARAQVVLAGLPNLGPFAPSWDALATLYHAGAKGAFDAIAVHPWARSADNVVRSVAQIRRVARRWGDRSPILVTELGWSTRASLHAPGLGLQFVDTTLRGQARRLTAAYRMLAAARGRLRIEGVFWATWLSSDAPLDDWTQWTGLARMRGSRIVRKPALAALRAVANELEGPAAGRAP
jgi:hypothetical protein